MFIVCFHFILQKPPSTPTLAPDTTAPVVAPPQPGPTLPPVTMTDPPSIAPETVPPVSTVVPTTEQPVVTTEAPTTEQPVATEAPTELPLVTEAPTEQPIATEAPTTDAPTEEPVATEAPTEPPLVTESPTEQPIATEAPTTTETSVTTEVPTQGLVPPPDEGVLNDNCTEGVVLAFGDSISGSTVNATLDPIASSQACGTASDLSAPGVWYQVQVPAMDDSTNDTSTGTTTIHIVYNATYEAQVSVYTGDEDCSNLVCIDGTEGNPVDNFRSGFVSWETNGGFFYILVHGFDGQVGNFILSVEEQVIPSNVDCDNAIEVQLNEAVFGETTLVEEIELEVCSYFDIVAKGIWYILPAGTFDESSETLQAVVRSNYNSQLSVYTGPCNDLQCVPGVSYSNNPTGRVLSTNAATWDADPSQDYIILVHGIGADVGTFSLTVSDIGRPSNDDCEGAVELKLGDVAVGGTTLASSDEDVEFCGQANPNSAPGVWFTVQGNGTTLKAEFNADYDAQLSLFRGGTGNSTEGCSNLACLDGTEGAPPGKLQQRQLIVNLEIFNHCYDSFILYDVFFFWLRIRVRISCLEFECRS